MSPNIVSNQLLKAAPKAARPAHWLVLLALVLLPAAAIAQTLGYAAGLRDLYRINLETGELTKLGAYSQAPIVPPEIVDVEGLALAPDGQLYGVADGLDLLIRLNPGTGRSTRVGTLTVGALGASGLDYGLTFTADGKLWMSSDTAKALWEVNPATGATRLVGNLGVQISGLAARGNEVFGIGVTDTVTGPGDQGLYRINVQTATATLIGSFAEPAPVVDAGLDFDTQGRLWAVLDFNPRPVKNFRPTELAQIDPNTGQILSRRPLVLTNDDLEGLAIAPPNLVPAGSPSLVAVPTMSFAGLMLLGLIALALGMFAAHRLVR